MTAKYRVSKKILCDGALYIGDNQAVASYIISNGDTELARGIEKFRYEGKSSEVVEARAIRLGVERALSLDITHISIGCDNLNIVRAIREDTNLSDMEDVQEVKRMRKQAKSFSIFHVDRETVEEAHNLGRRMYEG